MAISTASSVLFPFVVLRNALLQHLWRLFRVRWLLGADLDAEILVLRVDAANIDFLQNLLRRLQEDFLDVVRSFGAHLHEIDVMFLGKVLPFVEGHLATIT